jgi:ParB-like chromosome segregation protein Spo0J
MTTKLQGPLKAFTSLADLTPDPRNVRKHAARNLSAIVDAIHEVGTAQSIVIDEDGVILAGNATVDAATAAGVEYVNGINASGTRMISPESCR